MLSLYALTAPAMIRNGPVFVLLAAVATWWVSKRLIKTGVFTLREAIFIVWRYLFSSRNFRNTIVAGVVASYAITRVTSFTANAFRQAPPLTFCSITSHHHGQALDAGGMVYHNGRGGQLLAEHRRGRSVKLCAANWSAVT